MSSLGLQLYTKDFYEMCKTKLRPGGILVRANTCCPSSSSRSSTSRSSTNDEPFKCAVSSAVERSSEGLRSGSHMATEPSRV